MWATLPVAPLLSSAEGAAQNHDRAIHRRHGQAPIRCPESRGSRGHPGTPLVSDHDLHAAVDIEEVPAPRRCPCPGALAVRGPRLTMAVPPRWPPRVHIHAAETSLIRYGAAERSPGRRSRSGPAPALQTRTP